MKLGPQTTPKSPVGLAVTGGILIGWNLHKMVQQQEIKESAMAKDIRETQEKYPNSRPWKKYGVL